MACGRGIPDDQVVLSALDQLQNIVEHVFFFDPGGPADVIDEIVIEGGKGRDDFIDLRAEPLLPFLQNNLGADLDAVEVGDAL